MEFWQPRPVAVFKTSPGLGYYAQRLATGQRLRSLVSSGLSAWIRRRGGPWSAPDAAGAAAARVLAEQGYAPLPALLAPGQLHDIHAFLRSQAMIDYDHKQSVFTLGQVPPGVKIADYPLRTILDCPHVLELANSPLLLGLAGAYLGCKPTVSALWLRWSFPGQHAGRDLQAFHRDSDDWRFLKVFLYLTEVDAGAGPHVYVRGSHRLDTSLRLKRYGDQEVAREHGDAVLEVTGPAGFGFAADTFGIHKGKVPTARPRLLLQIQYSLLPIYAYQYRPEPYDGPLELDPYINRLILRRSP